MRLRTPVENANAPVVLDPDKLSSAQKHAKDIHFALATMTEWLANNTLERDTSYNIISVMEHHLADLATIVGYKGDLQKEMQERSGEIRAANMTIHELRRRMGSSRGIDGLQEQLAILSDAVSAHWSDMGFGTVDGSFKASYGHARYEAKLCCYLHLRDFESDSHESNKKSSKELLAEIVKDGLVVASEDSGRDHHVVDCPASRDYLVRKIRERFPNMEIRGWGSNSFYRRDKDICSLREMTITIPIDDLPAKEKVVRKRNKIKEEDKNLLETLKVNQTGVPLYNLSVEECRSAGRLVDNGMAEFIDDAGGMLVKIT